MLLEFILRSGEEPAEFLKSCFRLLPSLTCLSTTDSFCFEAFLQRCFLSPCLFQLSRHIEKLDLALNSLLASLMGFCLQEASFSFNLKRAPLRLIHTLLLFLPGLLQLLLLLPELHLPTAQLCLSLLKSLFQVYTCTLAMGYHSDCSIPDCHARLGSLQFSFC